MIRVNLLPVRDLQKLEKFRMRMALTVFTLIAALLGVGAGYLLLNNQIEGENAAIQAANEEIKKLQVVLGRITKFKKLKANLEGKLKILEELKADKYTMARAMDEVGVAIPDKVWLTSYSTKGKAVQMDGIGLDEKSVADFMKRLESSPSYQNVDLTITQQSLNRGRGVGRDMKMQAFKVSCGLQRPTAQAPAKAQAPAATEKGGKP